jgi:competence protein ComEC
VRLKGIVSRQPEERDRNTRIRLETEYIDLNGEWQEISGTVMLYTERYPQYSYGDRLELNGELLAPASFDDFDYAAYLARQDIFSVMYYPKTLFISSGGGQPLLDLIFQARQRLAEALGASLPEPHAALAQGMLLGIRSHIPEEVSNRFNISGISHILAISGLHVGVITGMLMAFFQFILGKRHYYYVWLALLALWLYAMLAGASPPVIRAAIMASIFLLAELTGRQKNIAPALFFAGAIMLTANPGVIAEVSFQLSMTAMLGLVYIFPLLKQSGEAAVAFLTTGVKLVRPLAAFVMESLLLTTAASLAVWPLTALYFGRISPAAPLATLASVPALAPIIVTSLLTAIGGAVFVPLGQIFGWLAWMCLSYLLAVANLFSSLPAASVDIDIGSASLLAAYYLLLGGAIYGVRVWQRSKLRTMATPGSTSGR